MENERIYTETPKTSIWDRIDILTSLNGAKQEIEFKLSKSSIDLNDELIMNKSKGVAFCVRSARDLFKQSSSRNLTPSLTSIYYGTYNLLSALLIGDINNLLTLENVENFSKNGGHGIKSIYKSSMTSLANDEFIYCCNNGFYKELLKGFNYKVEDVVMSKNYRKIEDIPDDEINKLISLKDLLSRIPELKNIYSEIFKEQPNYLNYHASMPYTNNKAHGSISVSEFQNTHFLKSKQINYILNLPIEYVFDYKKETPNSTLKEEFRCEKVPKGLITRSPKYNSPLAISCTIKPILGIDEVLLLYFKTFYMLSIWTRYRPNLWREVCEGKYDHYRSLFSILTDVSERIIPNLFLNKFYNRNFLFASHSYWS